MITDLLNRLSRHNITFKVVDDNLDLRAAAGVIDEELLVEIKNHKNELINLIKSYSESALSPLHIPLAKKSESYILSSAQRRLWILCQLGGNEAYNIHGVYLLKGNLNISVLEDSIKALIGRHESLRTTFEEDELGNIRQYINDFNFNIIYRDFSQEDNSEDKLKEALKKQYQATFDLSKGPLIRSGLYRLDENKLIFFYVLHHIVSDGWSMRIFIKELLQLYYSKINGKGNPLKNLKIQYKDYAVWQQKNLKDGKFKLHKDYWLSQFNGELPVLNLPENSNRPAVITYNGKTITREISLELVDELKSICSDKGATLYMGLLATVKVLLYKYTQQDDIIIGSPIAGRTHPMLEKQIGFYANTIPIRTKLDNFQSYIEVLEKVKNVTLQSFEHAVFPFDELVDELDLIRDSSRNALFDVLVVLQNSSISMDYGDGKIKGLDISEYSHDFRKTSKFDLSFNFCEQSNGVNVFIEFNSDIYAESNISFLANHLIQLLSRIVEAPSCAIAELNYLEQEEIERLLVGFNNTKVHLPKEKTVIDFFEKQVLNNKNKIAITSDKEKLTYEELNVLSNRLAHYLVDKCKVKKNDRIGVFMNRSTYSAASMIAIMKLGCCYVPIDPNYPLERVKYISEDSNLRVILSKDTFIANSKEFASIIVDLSSINLLIEKTSNPQISQKDSSDAFIIYTSGSTGNPKGVLQTHLMLLNLINWDITKSGIPKGLRHLQYSSFSFDSSLHDIFFALSGGGSIYLVSDALLLDYRSLMKEIIEHQVEVLSFPFTALINFFGVLEDTDMEGHRIKHIVSTGEQLNLSKKITAFLNSHQDIIIHNHYGPSETHVVTSHSMSAEMGNIVERSPIGKPISNTIIYILDESLNIVPIGVVGNIFIAGDCLAHGYLNKDEITKEKFINNVFQEGTLMYNTGDLGKWMSNGNIEFLGRKDNQVKIRGYRVELGEIEKILLMLAGVNEVLVVAKIFVNLPDKTLVVYFTSTEKYNVNTIRNYLSQSLPNYMVPTHYVNLSSFPLTTNGKVDINSLPNPLNLEVLNTINYVAPTSFLEKKIVEIWSKILGKENIGIEDNFFELGGHSILAIRIAAEIRKELEIDILPIAIYQLNTVVLLAQSIEISKKNEINDSLFSEEIKL